MFVGLPTDDDHVRGICEIDGICEDQSTTYEGWSKVPLHSVDSGRTMRIATAASWLVNWILLFSKIAVVIVSNSKAVSIIAISDILIIRATVVFPRHKVQCIAL